MNEMSFSITKSLPKFNPKIELPRCEFIVVRIFSYIIIRIFSYIIVRIFRYVFVRILGYIATSSIRTEIRYIYRIRQGSKP